MKFLIHAAVLLALGVTFASGDSWPQWRGPQRDGVSTNKVPESLSIPQGQPIWRLKIGGGFSSPIADGGRIFYLDENESNEVAHCIDAASGKEIWAAPYAAVYKDEWGAGPRSTPFTDGKFVFAQSCDGHFCAMDIKTGEIKWQLDFDKDFGVKFLGSKAREGTASRRGNNGSGVIDNGAIIIPVGNTQGATLVAVDQNSGKVLWKSGNDEAAYSSLMMAEFSGVKQVVAYTADSLSGFDRGTGAVLWRVPLRTNAKRHAATPVIFGSKVVVNSHTFGTVCFEIQKAGNEFQAKQAWLNQEAKVNLATFVYLDGYLYGFGPAGDYVCLNAADGQFAWRKPGFGKENASTIAWGKNLIIVGDAGQFFLIKANPKQYEEIGSSQICGKNWNYPALFDGKLLIRDNRELILWQLLKSS